MKTISKGQRYSCSVTEPTTHAITTQELLSDPPSGVDFMSLQGEKNMNEQCEQLYDKAFREAGGPAALRENASLSADLSAQVAQWRKEHDFDGAVAQIEPWQSYQLQDMMKKLGNNQPVRLCAVWAFDFLVAEIKEEVCSTVVLEVADVKKWERAAVKTRIKYGNDCSRLVDMNRVTLLCPDIRAMYAVADFIFKKWGPLAGCESCQIVEWEDHYQNPMPGGYRHLQALLDISGVVWEVQLTTKPVSEAKHHAGHKLYKTTRFIREMLLFAAMEDDCETLRQMLCRPGVTAIADPNVVKDKHKLGSLHHAAFNGNLELTELLLDTSMVSCPADLWSVDATWRGQLPLNYAINFRHWDVAKFLVKEMMNSTLPRVTDKGQKDVAAVSRACFRVFDSYADVPDLFRDLVLLWNAIDHDAKWSGRTPLEYALNCPYSMDSKIKKEVFEPAVQVIMSLTNLWSVDNKKQLPIEAVMRAGFKHVAEKTAMDMADSIPGMLSSEAIASLDRCRGKNIPGLFKITEALGTRQSGYMYTLGDSDDSRIIKQYESLSLECCSSCMPPAHEDYSCLLALDNELFAGTTRGKICRWDMQDGFSNMSELKGGVAGVHSQRILCLIAESPSLWPDGQKRCRRIYSGSSDNTARIWDLLHAKCLGKIQNKNQDVVAMARLGQNLYCAVGHVISVWQVTAKINTTNNGALSIDMKRDELRGHTADVSVLLVRKLTGQGLWDRDMIFSAGKDSTIRLWDRDHNMVGVWTGHSKDFDVRLLATDASGRIFSAAQSIDFTGSEVFTWSLSDNKDRSKIKAKWKGHHNFTDMHCAENFLYLADLSGWIRIWDVDTDVEVTTLKVYDDNFSALKVAAQTSKNQRPGSSPSDTPPRSVSPRSNPASRPPSLPPSRPRSPRKELSELQQQQMSLNMERDNVPSHIKSSFRTVDRNRDGRLSFDELHTLLRKGNPQITKKEVTKLFGAADIDGDKRVSFDEFVDFVFSHSMDANGAFKPNPSGSGGSRHSATAEPEAAVPEVMKALPQRRAIRSRK